MARTKPPANPRSPRSRPSPRPTKPRSDLAPFDGDESQLVVMGRVVAAVGIQGWVKLKSFTAEPEALDEFADWVVRTRQGWRYMALEEFAVRPNGTVAKLAGCDDRDAAERLKGAEIAIPRQALGESGEGLLFQVDLVGLEVVDESGASLGEVEGFFATGETSVMVVRGPPPRGQDQTGTRERLIPFIPDYVKAVDREAKRITVDWKADYDA